MSSLNDTTTSSDSEYLLFPSNSSYGRLLCLTGRHSNDGGRNSYALAWPDAIPPGATLLAGLTFVSDTYYDYHNIWHGLSAVFPFVGWHLRNGTCEAPARWVLYHWGELRLGMGPWVGSLMWATFGERVHVDGLDRVGPTCFERALVFRHNLGAMGREKRLEVFDVLRCKARAYCNVSQGAPDKIIGLTLLLRTGPRSFKNESGVVRIFERECGKMDSCRLTVARSDDLSFCDQVKLMSETDILASPHGAQLTNMFLMERDSSVMEFYPRGWLELAGVGQYVYKWEASWSGMRHQGAWRDPEEGEECPNPKDRGDCFSFYKSGKIGHNETFLTAWIVDVLNQEKIRRSQEASSMESGNHYVKPSKCPCS
ncbi:Glycosyltransferase AER61 [Cinnamomum micranthum f. kanehirae]|uniref:Glycosyltransferase AER61 n=1 Tax=Cinnamomum micranthum f. kanehirae TaxID=337451 RepID=A0A443PGT0_9MAGN|nr:Glycosyltransferase AER61 [Cinnamomum micranthum f. kanehirae]